MAQLLERLTRREKEVLGLVTRGMTSSAIAQSLNLSRRTVEAHRRNIIGKLGAGRLSLVQIGRYPSGEDGSLAWSP